MKRLWAEIINIGIHDGVTRSEAKHIVLVNGLTALTLYLPAFLLNRQRKYLAAKTYLLITALFNTSFASVLVGGPLNMHLFLLSVYAAGFFVYAPHEKNYRNAIFLLVTLAFIGLEIWFWSHPGWVFVSSEWEFLQRVSNNFGLLLFNFCFLYYVAWNYQRAERQLSPTRRGATS